MRVRFGDCVLDSGHAGALPRGRTRAPSPKAFRVLELLLENRPRAVSKDEIHEKVWPGTFVSEATLASAISDIRAAIGEDGGIPASSGPSTASDTPSRGTRSPPSGRRPFSERVAISSSETGRSSSRPARMSWARETGVAIRINDHSISRRHARIIVGGDSARLEDLGSKNGTFVGKTFIRSPRTLADGDQLRVGDVMMMFRLVSDADSTHTIGDHAPRERGISRAYARTSNKEDRMAKKKPAKKSSGKGKKLNLKASETEFSLSVPDLSSGHITYSQNTDVQIDEANRTITITCR